jgi:hypothetical protein
VALAPDDGEEDDPRDVEEEPRHTMMIA